jgi:hypothetical protein
LDVPGMTVTTLRVLLEDDPTPLVLNIGRTLRTSTDDPELGGLIETVDAKVAMVSKHDSQSATLRFADGRVTVVHGVDPDASIRLVVDLTDRFAVESVDGAEPDADVVATMTRLLQPALPAWAEAARDFWHATRDDAGMPKQLTVACEENGQDLILGDGLPGYLISGTAEKLARVFTGTDVFLDEVYGGSLAVRGTMTQLSVMAGASLKVRFNV